MTELNKPDMVAVLNRTKIGKSLDDLLIPVYECISNSIHAMEDRLDFDKVADGMIDISIELGDDPEQFSITIRDNGVGLDEKNYEHFLTPYSGHKLSRKGKGVGRFLAFKCFQHVHYESMFEVGSKTAARSFKFDIFNTHDEIVEEEDVAPNLKDVGCLVTYRGMKPIF